MVREVQQVKKSENDNLFQCQNITKTMKIVDFTVKTQVKTQKACLATHNSTQTVKTKRKCMLSTKN